MDRVYVIFALSDGLLFLCTRILVVLSNAQVHLASKIIPENMSANISIQYSNVGEHIRI